ncbi:substrate-binding domain-containing protein [Spirillospora sp. CA-294931]|uniref:substrate-binding domain-containing protein n=1 Tax=Spirillospora sp. CA-294931 TaxID=3240042 RepID=UPI003D8EAD01
MRGDERDRSRRRGLVIAAVAVLLVAGVGGGAWALGLFSAPACTGERLGITVAAQPEAAPALSEAAARFNVEAHRVDGRCVTVRVNAVAPTTYIRDRPRADAWVPESGLWLGVARSAGLGSVAAGGPSVAATPVVLAATRPVESEFRANDLAASWKLLLGREADGLTLARLAGDPSRNMTGTVAMIAVGQLPGGGKRVAKVAGDLRRVGPGDLRALTALEREYRGLAVTTEQAVVAYNDAHRPNPLVAMTPREGTLMLDHPFVVTASDRLRKDAAEAFHAALGSRTAQETLQRRGFRTPKGTFTPDQARRHDLPEDQPKALRLPTRQEIARALSSWRA